jgi:hypothetical protein
MARSAIIVKLKAAGALKRRFRSLDEIAADLARAEARVSELKRERKSVLASEKARRQHQDPNYTAKLRAGRAAAQKDPESRARWLERMSETQRANGWYLPPMNREQRLAYNRLLRKGVPRHEALPVAIRYAAAKAELMGTAEATRAGAP